MITKFYYMDNNKCRKCLCVKKKIINIIVAYGVQSINLLMITMTE